MSSVGTRRAQGTLKATGATIDVVEVGFEPDEVIIKNKTNQCKLEWQAAEGEGNGTKTVAAGTRTAVTSGGPAPVAGTADKLAGFSLGAVTDINDAADEILHWVALKN